jgi:1-deoxy-D-xylulose-5-phosphate reductoisomerase
MNPQDAATQPASGAQRRTHLAILGSTGSIGRNALAIAAMFPGRFAVKALAARSNAGLLAEQIRAFQPEAAAVLEADAARRLAARLPRGCRTEILSGAEGVAAAAAWPSAGTTLTAVVGAAGLMPTLAAIDAGKTIALANKETLVMAGAVVTARAAAKGVAILPVDSEHSAIFQCLQGQRREAVATLLLTASGGPFRTRTRAELDTVTKTEALKHPNWQMGAKITIDSATLMNKGLEVIEATWLFGVPADRIRVLIHPQSIVHSMVAFRDGSVMAQLGVPDMKTAIAYALAYPERLPLNQPLPDFAGGEGLTFQDPDFERFPCLALAFDAARRGGSFPAVLNAANEVAVGAFLEEAIGFAVVAAVLGAHAGGAAGDLEAILAADRWARDRAAALVADRRRRAV